VPLIKAELGNVAVGRELAAFNELGAVRVRSDPHAMLVIRMTDESTDLTIAEGVEIVIVPPAGVSPPHQIDIEPRIH